MQIFKGESMQTLKKEAARVFTQFELTSEIITKLNTFNLTPTAKLVLLYLSTCYNPKHKEVFPKQKTIADKIGISERSVTRAIQELFKEGLILIECKYTNRYKFTSRIISEQPENLSDDLRQNDIKEDDNLADHDIEQIKETKNQQSGNKKSGGNVYTEGDKILAEYAIKHGARNIQAYINTLKSTGSAAKIIKEYNKKKFIAQRALNTHIETQNLLNLYRSYKENAVLPETCTAWKEFGKKLSIKK